MPAALTLYNLESELTALLDTEDLAESEEQQLAILREIATVTDAAVAKRDNVIRMFRHLELQQANVDAETKRLTELKAAYARCQERLEGYVMRVMQELVPEPKKGARKLEGSIGVLKLAKKAAPLEIEDESKIPVKFKRVKVTVDADVWQRFAPDPLVQLARADYEVKRNEVKEALKAGAEVPGADLAMESFRLEVK